MSAQIKTRFRTWKLTATLHTCTGSKDNFTFKISKLPGFEAALRAGKAWINEREGAEVWVEGYTNQYLQGEQNGQ